MIAKLVLICLSATVFNPVPVIAQTTDETSNEFAIPAEEQSQPSVKEAPEAPLYRSRSERDMKLLANAVNAPSAIIWLEAIDGPFLSLYEKEVNNDPEGAILLLHAEGQHSNWPATMELMRSTLPFHGWTTLATSLPNPDGSGIPKRTLPANPSPPKADPAEDQTEAANADEKSDPAADPGEDNELFDDSTGQLTDGSLGPTEDLGSADASSDPTMNMNTAKADEPKYSAEEIAYSRIANSIRYLNDLGFYNLVLIGDGMGAARAGHFLDNLPDPPKPSKNGEKVVRQIRAMIIINARNSVPNGDINLLSSLNDPELPTLDVFFGIDQRDDRDSLERMKFSMRQGFENYQQIMLPQMGRNTMLGENRLSRRVRGFITKYAKGVKIDNAIVRRR